MTEKRIALIIATYQYEDTDLRQLVSPAHDAEALSQVLKDPTIGNFEVQTLLNKPSYDVKIAIETFFSDRRRDELLLLYFSGHGIKDEDGKLYFSTTDTKRKLLRATAIEANFVNDVMQRSRSRRQVLLLDCCYSGAFARGMVAKADKNIGAREHFQGQGRVILTASDSMQYSFEGDQVEGKGEPSVFTSSLVHGLKSGEADRDGDGRITLDELYDYVHDRVTDTKPEQRPTKWDFGVKGKIVIARNPNPVVKPVELPTELHESIKDLRPWVREGAVHELGRLLQGNNKGLALSAHEALTHMKDDDSQKVKSEVNRILEEYDNLQSVKESESEKQAVAETAKTESTTIAKEKTESFKNAKQEEKAETESLAEEQTKKKPQSIEKTETETPKQVRQEHRQEEVDKKQPLKEQEVKTPIIPVKRSRLIWLLPSILVPFIGGMAVLGIYLSNSQKTVTTEEIIKLESIETVKEPSVPIEEVFEKPAISKTKFRSAQEKLSLSDVKVMLERYNFYCKEYDWNKEYSNPNGDGFQNKFNEQVKNGDKVILDYASGLMWQQSGSDEYMNYKNAKAYVAELNHKRVASYSDWRLPTLEEAMSLMEPMKNSDDLYVDSIFDSKQGWIWTSDLYSTSSIWVVGFSYGNWYYSGFNDGNDYYVRAVRSLEKSGTEEKQLVGKQEDKKGVVQFEQESHGLKDKKEDNQLTSPSETALITKTRFRSKPKELPTNTVKSMLKDKGFFDSERNKTATGFTNNYEVQHNGEVVYDRASGLMWQQSGSDRMAYESTKAYVAQLNSDRFAGYSDWRLPTLEEAMSLMEQEKNSDYVYIDSRFDSKQERILTSDMVSASSAWVVNFDYGHCFNSSFITTYVRAVR